MSEHVPYTYRVFWSKDDDKWVGTCTEFPSLSHLAAEPADAVTGIRDLIEDVARDMRANGEPVPEPLSSKT
jgi:predicted RNase H-like HicB family nuclease